MVDKDIYEHFVRIAIVKKIPLERLQYKRGRGRPPKLDRAIPGSSLEASPVKKKVAEGIRKSTRTKNLLINNE